MVRALAGPSFARNSRKRYITINPLRLWCVPFMYVATDGKDLVSDHLASFFLTAKPWQKEKREWPVL